MDGDRRRGWDLQLLVVSIDVRMASRFDLFVISLSLTGQAGL